MTKYWKEITRGAVIESATKPAGQWWREATEREYLAYRARIARAMGAIEKAVAYKTRLLER